MHCKFFFEAVAIFCTELKVADTFSRFYFIVFIFTACDIFTFSFQVENLFWKLFPLWAVFMDSVLHLLFFFVLLCVIKMFFVPVLFILLITTGALLCNIGNSN